MANKRKMVCVLDTENFDKNKQSILKFEKQRLSKLGGSMAHLSDSRALDVMIGTCSAVWGDGEDLHLASQKRTLAMVAHLVVSATDDNISQAVKCLAEWLGLEITYQRQGSNFKFRFVKPGTGEIRELQIPMRSTEQPQNRMVN